MSEGYRKIFWGIFIATFNIKLGSIKILPAFVGLLIICRGLGILYEESKLESFHKAHTIGLLATGLSFLGEVVGYFSFDSLDNSILMILWAVVYNVIELILFFKTIESSIEYLSANNHSDFAYDNTGKLKTYTIYSIINIIIMNFALFFSLDFLMFIAALIGVCLRVFMMSRIDKLKRLFEPSTIGNN